MLKAMVILPDDDALEVLDAPLEVLAELELELLLQAASRPTDTHASRAAPRRAVFGLVKSS